MIHDNIEQWGLFESYFPIIIIIPIILIIVIMIV